MDLPPGCRLSIEQDPSAADRNLIDEGLGAYNAPFLQDPGYDYFGIFVRDQHNAIRAGLVGNCYAGWLFVNLLWIEAALRRHGIGTALMQAAEQRALKFGCHSAWVDTFSFQGPEFYPRFGYKVFATLDCPPNNKRIFLRSNCAPQNRQVLQDRQVEKQPMPMRLEGSCRCGAVTFTLDSHTPYPYQRCYCSICRKSAGSGGYAINIMGVADTLVVHNREAVRVWHAPIDGRPGSAERHFCAECGTALWVSDRQWPELVHPFASAIDTPLPTPPANVHLLLRDKPAWVEPQIAPNDECFDGYPALSIEEWHKHRSVWID